MLAINEKVMKSLRYKNIIFDFDGVLAETNPIRIEGFRVLFSDYDQDQIDEIICFVKKNGGMSRYKKIRHFFEKILQKPISDETVQTLADEYSVLVKQKVIDAQVVEGSLEFLNAYCDQHNFAIVSGSDQRELREVCQKRGIEHFFDEILGSPVNKEENTKNLLKKRQWRPADCVFVGDAVGDLNVARATNMDFVGMNSDMTQWHGIESVGSIDSLLQLEESLSY